MSGDPVDSGEPEPRFVIGAGVFLYTLLALVALAWLWWRERLDALPERAIGEHGPLPASGVGLAAGIVLALGFAAAGRWLPHVRELERTMRGTFGRTGDVGAAMFVLFGAVAEELFFRLAVQDTLGLAGSVAVATALNSCVGGWRWLPFALVHALALGAIVHFGFGLLGSTTANAVSNYLNLRRIQCP